MGSKRVITGSEAWAELKRLREAGIEPREVTPEPLGHLGPAPEGPYRGPGRLSGAIAPPIGHSITPWEDLGALRGSQTPRLSTPPLRELTPQTSAGFDVIDFAANELEMPLRKWQEHLVIRALELKPDGNYRFRTVVVIVARQNGKSHLLKVLALWRLWRDRAGLVIGAAQTVSLSRMLLVEAGHLAADLPGLRRIYYSATLPQILKDDGSRYIAVSANDDAGRGYSADLVIIDELRSHTTWAPWSALGATTMARPRAQIWAITNAGTDESVVLNTLRESALAGSDPSLGIFEWSAPEGVALDDPEGWVAANPSLGDPGNAPREESLRAALASMPPGQFRTEHLCQRVVATETALDLDAWAASADPSSDLAPFRDRLGACLDVSLDGTHATLTAAAVTGDGRVRIETVREWREEMTMHRELAGVLAELAPAKGVYFAGGPSNRVRTILDSAGFAKVPANAAACMQFASMVAGGRILHSADPLTDTQVAGCGRKDSGDGFVFTRRGPGHCDAVYAAAGAVQAALTLPEPVSVASWGVI